MGFLHSNTKILKISEDIMANSSNDIKVRYYDSVQETKVEWLWFPYIPS